MGCPPDQVPAKNYRKALSDLKIFDVNIAIWPTFRLLSPRLRFVNESPYKPRSARTEGAQLSVCNWAIWAREVVQLAHMALWYIPRSIVDHEVKTAIPPPVIL